MTNNSNVLEPDDKEHTIRSIQRIRVLGLLPSIPLGGMERAALRVMHELHLRGANVKVLTNRRWGLKVRAEVKNLGLHQSGICHITALSVPRSLNEWCAAIISFLFTELELRIAHRRHKANALLSTSLHVAWFARRLARRSDTVSIFRIPNPPLQSRSKIRHAFNVAIWRTVGNSYDYLVCNSYYTANLVTQISQRPEKVRIIRNFSPTTNRLIHKSPSTFPAERRRVVFLGQISPQKGVDVLFECAQHLLPKYNDLDFVLAGPDVYLSSYREELKIRIQDAGLVERFIVLESTNDVRGLLRQMDVHVCPSLSAGDSFPNVILDAKKAGLPSVVFPTAGLPEAVDDGLSGIVTSSPTAQALAKSLALLLNDIDLCKRMGEAARKSLDKFDSDMLTQKWINLFTKPCNNKFN